MIISNMVNIQQDNVDSILNNYPKNLEIDTNLYQKLIDDIIERTIIERTSFMNNSTQGLIDDLFNKNK